MSQKPVLRTRKSGALVVAALIALVGTVPLAGADLALTPILLIPLVVFVWAWRAGTDVFPDRLRVRALVGSTQIPWERVAELAPDERGRVSALLDNGHVVRLTGVTRQNLPLVLRAAGQQVDDPHRDDAEATDAEARDVEARDLEARDADARDAEARDGEGRKPEVSTPPPPD